VQGQLGDLTLTGSFVAPPGGAAASIQGDVSNGICSIHYTVTRRG